MWLTDSGLLERMIRFTMDGTSYSRFGGAGLKISRPCRPAVFMRRWARRRRTRDVPSRLVIPAQEDIDGADAAIGVRGRSIGDHVAGHAACGEPALQLFLEDGSVAG